MTDKKNAERMEILQRRLQRVEDILRRRAKNVLQAGVSKAKKVHAKTQKISPKTKRKILVRGAIVTGAVAIAGLFGQVHKIIEDSKENKSTQDSIALVLKTLQENVETQKNDIYSKKYKITDEKSFIQLYKTALPLIQLSMMPTEIMILEAYDDRNGNSPNTIGLGSWWYPADGNPKSSEWVHFSNYAKKHPKLKITGDQAMALVDGWYQYREDGRILTTMYNKLKGSELSICEFTAAATTLYNNEKLGWEFCDYIQKNYKNPIKCAYKLTTLEPPSCKNGILCRHTHEALLYLNLDNYATHLPYLKIKEGTNSKNKKYYTTSVNQISAEMCRKVQKDLAKGGTKEAKELKRKICGYICKGGRTFTQVIKKNISNPELRAQMTNYGTETTLLYEEAQGESIYTQALQQYADGNYKQALTLFNNVLSQGYDGADIHSDMSIAYYNLGDYENCIQESRKVLATGERHLYAFANYNAGKAYEAMENYDRAAKNYHRAVVMAEEYNMNDAVYQKAAQRVDSVIKSRQPRGDENIPQKQKKTPQLTTQKKYAPLPRNLKQLRQSRGEK